MPTCSGCDVFFPKLSTGLECSRCTKLQGVSEMERKVIEAYPACRGCSIVYKTMGELFCGKCLADGVKIEDTFEEEVDVEGHASEEKPTQQASQKASMTSLLRNAENHRADATAHRLQKRPKNTSLQKADNYRSLKQAAHKLAAKKRNG